MHATLVNSGSQPAPSDRHRRGVVVQPGWRGWANLNHQGTPRPASPSNHKYPPIATPRLRSDSDHPCSAPNLLVFARVAVSRDASGSSLHRDLRLPQGIDPVPCSLLRSPSGRDAAPIDAISAVWTGSSLWFLEWLSYLRFVICLFIAPHHLCLEKSRIRMRLRRYWLILEFRLGQCVLGAVRCLSSRFFFYPCTNYLRIRSNTRTLTCFLPVILANKWSWYRDMLLVQS